MPTPLALTGFTFEELFYAEGLQRLDHTFLKKLQVTAPALYQDLLDYRSEQKPFTTLRVSELLLGVAPILEEFMIDLFKIEEAAGLAQARTLSENPISAFKKFFVLRRAKKLLSTLDLLPPFLILNNWLQGALAKAPLKTDDLELAISLLAVQYAASPDAYQDEILKLTQWCAHGLGSPEAKAIVKDWTSFRLPERTDHANLVPHIAMPDDKLNRLAAPLEKLRQRDGFQLTDPRMNARAVQDEINYCIYCHDHEGDFCSKGFPVKKSDPEQGLKKDPLDVTLTGCPLEEKISEMHILKRDGLNLAALSMIMVDNPMCPATGHRICNDCMKACIYQKQDPVNVPQVETRVLVDVLSLPWGVEIYDLLTRWNPLRQKQWAMKPYNGLKVMVAGLGPAGFTLAHHLLLEGFAVVGFDGLKIEPLDDSLIKQPIHSYDSLKERLDERLMAGFGGVAEYGITVRWDKNFLKLIYISLMRRPYFQAFGNTRFGGTVQVQDAWEMGFDHFVVAVGAGLPKALPVAGSMAPGMRQANDFLMALQLGNAAKKSSLTNIQVRLPAVIIGGGLTGVDTATEVQAYYLTQVEKTLIRYEKLGEETVLKGLTPASVEILQEFIRHAKAARQERERALALNVPPDFISLIRQWGGVTIVYRRNMQSSPAYIHNHEELAKALQEGVFYLESLEPTAVDLNQFGHVETLVCHKRTKLADGNWQTTTEEMRVPARSIFVATGTQPNTAYEFEHRGTFNRAGLRYQHYEDQAGELIVPHGIEHCKETEFGAFTSYHQDDKRVSLIGDTHPVFHGSVVKAIASGMRTYPKILRSLQHKLGQKGDHHEYQQFAHHMDYLFKSYIKEIQRISSNTISLTVQAPLAAKHFQPGQFYRLQNFEKTAPFIEGTSLQIEPLALVAAGANKEAGTLQLFVFENGASSKLCATFKKGAPVSLMGPSGVRAKISDAHETLLIVGNQLSLPFLKSYGKALKEKQNKLIFLGYFEQQSDFFLADEMASVCDILLLTCQAGAIPVNRPQDISIEKEGPLSLLLKYASLEGSAQVVPLADVDRAFIIGDSAILKQFQLARQNELKPILIKSPRFLGSVYSTMQCMLKGVCAQCLQWQVDPETGKRTKAVFACSWPDQPLELIDYNNVAERHVQNQLQEHLSRLWVDYLFDHCSVPRV